MARLMLAWELGGGLGHAAPLAQLADALLSRGHEVHLVWKDLAVGHQVLCQLIESPNLHLWQAPVWLPVLGGLPEPASHAEILFRAGFTEGDRLLGLVRAWRSLYQAIQPQLLVTDHAPTALLAARGLGMRRASMGIGFFVPPACSPLPSFRDWEPVPSERIAAADACVLTTCNAVLRSLGALPMSALHELFETDEVFLVGWPELDHLHGLRAPGPRVWGALPARAVGRAPSWPDQPGPRIFGYLRRDHPAAAALLDALRAGPWCSLLHVSGMPREELARWSGTALTIVDELVDLPAALATADLVLCHANAGTVYASLTAGVPLLMLPLQAEHLLLARRVAAVGAGVYLWPHEVVGGFSAATEAVLGSPGFRSAAHALAARNGPGIHGDVLAAITARCEALAQPQ